ASAVAASPCQRLASTQRGQNACANAAAPAACSRACGEAAAAGEEAGGSERKGDFRGTASGPGSVVREVGDRQSAGSEQIDAGIDAGTAAKWPLPKTVPFVRFSAIKAMLQSPSASL